MGWFGNREDRWEKKGIMGWFGNREDKEKRTESRRNYRLEKIKALTAKFYAVAAKRKWLVFMMALGIAIYFIITSGGGFSFMGMFETVKGFFN